VHVLAQAIAGLLTVPLPLTVTVRCLTDFTVVVLAPESLLELGSNVLLVILAALVIVRVLVGITVIVTWADPAWGSVPSVQRTFPKLRMQFS